MCSSSGVFCGRVRVYSGAARTCFMYSYLAQTWWSHSDSLTGAVLSGSAEKIAMAHC